MKSHAAARQRQLSVLRMRPLTASLRNAVAHDDIEVVQAHYTQRGWNGDGSARVAEVRAVLDTITARHGDIPIVLLGHSMGGRVAARLAQDPRVSGIVALAPWWPEGEGLLVRPDQELLVVHGTADRWTSATQSREQAVAVAQRGGSAQWVPIVGGGHFMLRPLCRWHHLAVSAALRMARYSAGVSAT